MRLMSGFQEFALSFSTLAFIVAALLFIAALAGLSKQDTARNGNYAGIAGMGVAIAATILRVVAFDQSWSLSLFLIIIAMGIGGALGIYKAMKVEMTGMPELIALLHSFKTVCASFE